MDFSLHDFDKPQTVKDVGPAKRKNRSLWAWAISGAILGSCSAMAMYLPATLVSTLVGYASSGRARLVGEEGTVWSGSAALELLGPQGRGIALPGRVKWSNALSFGGLGGSIEATCCMKAPLLFRASWPLSGRLDVKLSAFDSTWPAEALSGLGGALASLMLAGNIKASSAGFEASLARDDARATGSINFVLEGACSALSPICPLGTYAFDYEAMGNMSRFALSTKSIGSPLSLSGKGQADKSGARFDGEVVARPDSIEGASNLLSLFGKRDGEKSTITYTKANS